MGKFADRVASAAEARDRAVMRAEAALAPMRELLDDIRDNPGYALVGLVVERQRVTMDGRVGGTMVVPPLFGGRGPTAMYAFEVEHTTKHGGLIRVTGADAPEGTVLAYGDESRAGRTSLTWEIGKVEKSLAREGVERNPAPEAARYGT